MTVVDPPGIAARITPTPVMIGSMPIIRHTRNEASGMTNSLKKVKWMRLRSV
jgi:hypothetical protein